MAVTTTLSVVSVVLCVSRAVLSVVVGAWSVRCVGWADWVDCRCFLSFVFLGDAWRLELSPCNTFCGVGEPVPAQQLQCWANAVWQVRLCILFHNVCLHLHVYKSHLHGRKPCVPPSPLPYPQCGDPAGPPPPLTPPPRPPLTPLPCFPPPLPPPCRACLVAGVHRRRCS